ACKVTKILAFTSMKIPTNTYINKRLTIDINGYTRRYEKVTFSVAKTLHFVATFAYFMQPFYFRHDWRNTKYNIL
ncbi:hypothetical protein, partial [Leuconostoc mesenteroides]|uniref:hypothetical protein n=1 Tax=Leuconostoc mesenteroides TaxID=1245 RepID=UPI0020730E4B